MIKLGLLGKAYILSYSDMGIESEVQDQPGLQREFKATLSDLVGPKLQIKVKKRQWLGSPGKGARYLLTLIQSPGPTW